MTAREKRKAEILWDDLRILLCVAEAGSFRKGAATAKVALNTCRSAIWRIEDRVGELVFARSVEGVTPTAAGRPLIATARSVQEFVRYRAVASGDYA